MRKNTSSAGPDLDTRKGMRARRILAQGSHRGGMAALATLLVLTASAASAQDAGGPARAPAPSEDTPAILAMNEADQTLQVTVGHSKLLRAGEPLGTIIVGDDTIAAATTGAGNSVILTGLAAGSTNLIVLGQEDEMLLSSQVAVVPVAGRLRSTVTVLKGASIREKFECRGTACEPVSTDRATTEMPLVLMAAPSEAATQAPPSD